MSFLCIFKMCVSNAKKNSSFHTYENSHPIFFASYSFHTYENSQDIFVLQHIYLLLFFFFRTLLSQLLMVFFGLGVAFWPSFETQSEREKKTFFVLSIRDDQECSFGIVRIEQKMTN